MDLGKQEIGYVGDSVQIENDKMGKIKRDS
jgi:hypothetical protein